MTGVHETAERGFSASPERYDRGRPSYPPPAVSLLVEELGIGTGGHVIDLAAGTGILTEQLADHTNDLIAVEPVAAMAGFLSGRLPRVPVVRAVAESLPLADSSITAVTVGQAFHWFDARMAWQELSRVVRSGGGVGLIWNVRDRTVPWLDELWQVMDRLERKAPWRDHDADPLRGLEGRPGFGQLLEATFHHEVRSTLDGVLDRFASVSHVAVLSPDRRQQVLDEVTAIVNGHPEAWVGDEVVVPYRTDVYITKRL